MSEKVSKLLILRNFAIGGLAPPLIGGCPMHHNTQPAGRQQRCRSSLFGRSSPGLVELSSFSGTCVLCSCTSTSQKALRHSWCQANRSFENYYAVMPIIDTRRYSPLGLQLTWGNWIKSIFYWKEVRGYANSVGCMYVRCWQLAGELLSVLFMHSRDCGNCR